MERGWEEGGGEGGESPSPFIKILLGASVLWFGVVFKFLLVECVSEWPLE